MKEHGGSRMIRRVQFRSCVQARPMQRRLHSWCVAHCERQSAYNWHWCEKWQADVCDGRGRMKLGVWSAYVR